DYQILDTRALQKLYPGMSLKTFGPPRAVNAPGFGEPQPGRISGGIYIPAAGYVSDPQLAAHNLMHAAQQCGAVFRFGARVCDIRQRGGRIIGLTLENGDALATPVLVNAAGPHSAQINRLAGIDTSLKIRTRAHRHEVVYLRAPSGYTENGNGFLVDMDCALYTRPDGADLLIGTTDPACDEPMIVDPDDYSSGFTEQWTLEALRAAQRFPALGISNTARGTVGLYDVSDDWIPLYDKTDLTGYYLAIGTSGNQFKNAPLIGDLMAEILDAESRGIDHDRTPAHLHLDVLNRDLDLSFYSRNRTVQTTSSVMA
ncbi:MAG: FAD-binding oxidoreductase, partial [Pseudomonadales bacterium]|nr:FAD-binding oxidoreductase [Pseudomonadales bacterium]